MIKHALFIFVLAFAGPAWSLVEIKMAYSGLLSDPDKDKIYNGSAKMPTATANFGLGADVVFDLPLAGFGVGMRYENLGLKYSGNGIHVESELSRTALLVNWRWIDTLVYFGPIFSAGISHSGGSLSVIENGTTIADLEAENQTSYSAGLELGAKLIGFRVGVEAGYIGYELKDLTGSTGSITRIGKLDMSGPYAKILLGFGI